MKQTFYKKQGKRYVPVSEYDSELLDSFPKGTHIVMVYPGGRSYRYNIDPALGPMIAAGRYAEDEISRRIVKASDLRPRSKPVTEEQMQAWKFMQEAYGDENHMLEWPSAREVAEEAVKVMTQEAEKMMTNPAVRKAWDHFMLMAKLSMENRE